ncbi:MAG: nickel insertion protein [Verrucomicrobiia bacterium]
MVNFRSDTSNFRDFKNIPFEQIDEPHELVTPTGAALLAELVTHFDRVHHFKIEKVGYGAGTRDLDSRPNVLRAMLISEAEKNWETIDVLETNLDDISPEIVASVKERLLVNGALDVFSMPVLMKKGRLGVLLMVLSEPQKSEVLMDLILTETSAFGVRKTTVTRKILRREWQALKTEWGDIQS